MRLTLIVLLLPIAFTQTVLAKNNIELTPFTSYRMGGDFTDSETNTSIDLEDGNGFGLILNWHYDKSRQGELLYSQYETDISNHDNSLTNSQMTVSYLHFGGNVQLSHGVVPFWLSGGLGATLLSPDDDSLDKETKLSGSIGVSTRYDITESVSFRIEGRVYGTFFDTDSAVFCNSANCKVYVESEVWVQTELMAGITFKF